MTILTTPEQRRAFYKRHLQGQTYEEIAKQNGVSKECVRYWCRRQKKGGSSQTKYRRQVTGILSQFNLEVSEKILELRRGHPRWGPGTILYKLKQEPQMNYRKLPSRASIGRYLHQWPEFRRKPRQKKLLERPEPPTQTHQRWQIDFKMDIKLANKYRISLHTVRDPFAGATIGARIYPIANTKRPPKRVPMEDVCTTLRECFAQWGTLPDEVQTDGEPTIVSSTENAFPSKFTLWLVGLGCKHRVIRSGKPTDNAEVERCHRTLNDYAVVGNEDMEVRQFQSVLDGAIYELNYEVPSQAKGCDGKSPIEAHPELVQPRRSYQPELELLLFDLDRVDNFLASFVWERKVGKTGQITIGGQHQSYCVGRQFARQTVQIRFDPSDRNFVAFHTDDQAHETELKRWPARNLDIPTLMGFDPLPPGLGPQQLPLPLPVFEGVCFQ